MSPRRDLISSRCTLRRNFEGGEISRAATSLLNRLAPAHSSISIVQIVRVRLYFAYFESDDPFPCGEISWAAFVGTNLLIGAARFRGRRDFEVRRDFEEIRYLVDHYQYSPIHLSDTNQLEAGWYCQILGIA